MDDGGRGREGELSFMFGIVQRRDQKRNLRSEEKLRKEEAQRKALEVYQRVHQAGGNS